MSFRIERDTLGEIEVPADAYYGVQTMRAVENFASSGLRAQPDLVTATIFVKKAATEANAALGRLDPKLARLMIADDDEILAGKLREQFIVDVYQAGAGTSHNMTANEVLANRAAEIAGEPRGQYTRVDGNGGSVMSRVRVAAITVTFVVGTLTALPAHSAQAAPPAQPARLGPRAPNAQPRSKEELFAPHALSLLEPPDRDQWQKPEQIMDSLRIAEGSVVADLGAGGGWFSARLSGRVGPNGLVYAEDIQPAMLEVIERRKLRENLRNVRTILGTATDPRLPSGIDAALIVDAYREMEIPPADPVMLLRRVAESLKPDGRIGVVDFHPGDGGPGPDRHLRVNPEAVIEAATAAGLVLIAREREVNPFQFLLIFGKPSTSPRASP